MSLYISKSAAIFTLLDVCEIIFKMLPLQSLIRLSVIAHREHESVFNYLQHQIIRFLSRFFNNTIMFLQLLRHMGAVVSGSAALQILFALENMAWSANDLDLYVLSQRRQPLVDFFETSGFTPSLLHCSHPYCDGSICTIQSFYCGGHKVDLIKSKIDSALSPIFEFHSTMLMNYILADSIFSAYPSLTG
ncbi:hypothetical protein L210DRAFT_3386289 [Boletus edulis BED1]|uniref:Uncharacterized protein n=1 Tax=Boletus edulis BED1 TaxID=1328754 RepID=A0AAD4C8U8_BOLED|nr:hypothetical protein L210DRAFT_3386289 [Boletus edulis BED1]